jgi:hypothetical protein
MSNWSSASGLFDCGCTAFADAARSSTAIASADITPRQERKDTALSFDFNSLSALTHTIVTRCAFQVLFQLQKCQTVYPLKVNIEWIPSADMLWTLVSQYYGFTTMHAGAKP